MNRVVEQRKVVSKRPVDVEEEWLSGAALRVVYRGTRVLRSLSRLPDGEKNSFEEGYANCTAYEEKPKGRVRADACLVSAVGDHVRLKGWWSTHPRLASSSTLMN